MSTIRKLGLLVTWLAGIAVIGACGGSDNGGSTGIKDPAALTLDLGAVGTAFSSPQFASFQSLNGSFAFIGLGTTPPAMARAKLLLEAAQLQVPSLKHPRATRASARQAEALKALVAGAAANQARVFAGPTIDPTNLGNSWVWDEINDQYVEQVGGGPAGGARFELYALDPFTDLPVEPVVSVGHVDIIDIGTASLTGLQVVVVGGTTTYADYTVSAVVGPASVTAATGGFVTDGTQRIDFAATAIATASSVSYNITQFDVNDPDIQFTLSFNYSTTQTSDLFDFTFTIVYQGQTVRVDGTETDDFVTDIYTVDITLRVGGHVFAIIGYDDGTGDYTFTDANGNALTGDQLDVVETIFEAPGGVGDLIDEITSAAFEALGVDDDFGV